MIRKSALSAVVLSLVPILLGAGYLVQSSEDRITDLEGRVTLLEATVASLTEDETVTSEATQLHQVTGIYVGDATQIDGAACQTFYPMGTILFLTNWEGDVLGTSELGLGATMADGLCSQPFVFQEIPELLGYTFYLERRVAGSAYEFSLADMIDDNWNIEVVSRDNA